MDTPLDYTPLHDDAHRLNVTEALRRIEYWLDRVGEPHSLAALRALVEALKEENL